MNFEKYQNRHWDYLTNEERKEWDLFTQKHQIGISIWGALIKCSEAGKCTADCKIEPFIDKLPYDTTTPLLARISSFFLFHMKSTHGIDPEIFSLMIAGKAKIY